MRVTFHFRAGTSFGIEEQCCAVYFSSLPKEQACGSEEFTPTGGSLARAGTFRPLPNGSEEFTPTGGSLARAGTFRAFRWIGRQAGGKGYILRSSRRNKDYRITQPTRTRRGVGGVIRGSKCRSTLYNLRHGKSSFRIEEQCCAMYFSSYLEEQGCGPGRYFSPNSNKKNHLASNISPTLHGPALFLRGGSYTRTGFSRPQSARALVQTSRRRTVFYDGECKVIHKCTAMRHAVSAIKQGTTTVRNITIRFSKK